MHVNIVYNKQHRSKEPHFKKTFQFYLLTNKTARKLYQINIFILQLFQFIN